MFRENLFIKLAFVFINRVFLKMSNVEVQTQETKMNTVTVVSLFFETGKSGTNYLHKEKSRVIIPEKLKNLKELKERVW